MTSVSSSRVPETYICDDWTRGAGRRESRKLGGKFAGGSATLATNVQRARAPACTRATRGDPCCLRQPSTLLIGDDPGRLSAIATFFLRGGPGDAIPGKGTAHGAVRQLSGTAAAPARPG